MFDHEVSASETSSSERKVSVYREGIVTGFSTPSEGLTGKVSGNKSSSSDNDRFTEKTRISPRRGGRFEAKQYEHQNQQNERHRGNKVLSIRAVLE